MGTVLAAIGEVTRSGGFDIQDRSYFLRDILTLSFQIFLIKRGRPHLTGNRDEFSTRLTVGKGAALIDELKRLGRCIPKNAVRER